MVLIIIVIFLLAPLVLSVFWEFESLASIKFFLGCLQTRQYPINPLPFFIVYVLINRHPLF